MKKVRIWEMMSDWGKKIQKDLEKDAAGKQQLNGIDLVEGENPEILEKEKNFVEKSVTEDKKVLQE